MNLLIYGAVKSNCFSKLFVCNEWNWHWIRKLLISKVKYTFAVAQNNKSKVLATYVTQEHLEQQKLCGNANFVTSTALMFCLML